MQGGQRRPPFYYPYDEASYTYDSANRLLTAGDASYTYDEAGQLTSKADSAGTTQDEYSLQRTLY